MTKVLVKGIAIGSFTGLLLFELATGLLFFYGLGSGHGVNVAGAFVVTMTHGGSGFDLSVGAGYVVALLAMIAAFTVLVSTLLMRSYRRQAHG
jgi:hypothetical protein